MPQRTQDAAAGSVTVSAVVWAPYLEQLNQILTAISLALGIAFLVWRWYRAAKGQGVAE